MKGNGKDGWGPLVFTRSAYDEQRDMEIAHSVWVTCELHTTFQKGVYTLTVRAEPMLDYEYWKKHAVIDTFPSSHAQSFEALLYQQMYKLARMMNEASAEHARESAPKQTRGWRT